MGEKLANLYLQMEGHNFQQQVVTSPGGIQHQTTAPLDQIKTLSFLPSINSTLKIQSDTFRYNATYLSKLILIQSKSLDTFK